MNLGQQSDGSFRYPRPPLKETLKEFGTIVRDFVDSLRHPVRWGRN